MEILELKKRTDQNVKLTRKFLAFERLTEELGKMKLPNTIETAINKEIELINHFYGSDEGLINQLARAQKRILKLLEKQLRIVPRNHYLNLWMVLGMSAFGVPLGVVWGTTSGTMANLGIGLPIGMAIGIAVGAVLDGKARREGRQLDLDLKC
jgi:hypothetical protein